MDTWQMIREERASLVDALAALSPQEWDKPSLCEGWSVREVAGHLLALCNMTPFGFFAEIAKAGFRFGRVTTRGIEQSLAGRTDAELVEALRAKIDARNAPPGPTASWLGEAVVHSEDITRAITGGYGKHATEHVMVAADFYRGSNALIGGKRRVDGVTLQATDADWRRGSGPEVSGPMVALLLAITGRAAALDDLTGDGVAVLRGRA